MADSRNFAYYPEPCETESDPYTYEPDKNPPMRGRSLAIGATL